MPERLSPRAILERLVAFPTVSRDTNLPLIDWVEGYFDAHGIESHRHENETHDKAGLFAHVGPWEEGGVVLSGHTDVVPVDGQDWSSDPFKVIEKDGRLYGRGTCDMKGFDALAIWAMVEAKYAGLNRPLQIALTYDEEVGCIGAPPLIDAMQGVVPKADAVLVGEPTVMKTVTGHKGSIGFWVHFHGFEVHSSILHRGVSAVMWGAKLVDWANQINAELTAAEPSAMAALFDPPYTNAHVGQIQGGTAHNISAKDCELGLTFRVVPGESTEAWRARFMDKVADLEAGMQAVRPEAGITVTELSELPPFAPTQDNSAEAMVRALNGDNSDNFVSFGTEASHFQTAGYDAVVCGPGDIAVAHQPNEYISLAQFAEGQRFVEGLLQRLQ